MRRAVVLAVLAGCGAVVDGPTGDGPSITSISPERGSILGGTEVTITGANLDAGVARVVVDGVLAPTAEVVDGRTVRFVTPPGVQEGRVVDVTVFNDRGHADLPNAFRYNERPVVASISPARGRGAGGTAITIKGAGFRELEAGDAIVEIDGVAATNVVVVDDRTITATTGSGPGSPAFQPLDVVVSNTNGDAVLAGQFQVTQPGLIGLNGTAVFYIDTRTGRTIQLTRLDRSPRRCAPTAQGTMLGVVRQNPNRELVSFDVFGDTVTTIGNLTGARSLGAGLAAAGGAMYGITTDTSISNGPHVNNLVSVNVATAALTNVGTAYAGLTSPGASASIAPRDADSVWLLSNLQNGTLDRVAVATGVRTTGIALTGGPANGRARTSGAVGSSVYVQDRNSNQLYSVDTETGAVARFSTNPQTGFSFICSTPSTF